MRSLLALACTAILAAADPAPLTLWYTTPAPLGTTPGSPGPTPFLADGNEGGGGCSPFMNDALPIGNGRLGALVFGGTAWERLACSESSLWTGDANPSGGFSPTEMGWYQTLGNLWLEQPGHAAATDYRRDLDLATAIATTSYRVEGVTYRREVLASAADQVLALRLTADAPGRLTGTLRWQDAHDTTWPLVFGKTDWAETRGVDLLRFVAPTGILTGGRLTNGLRFATRIHVLPQGGTVAKEGDHLTYRGCDSLVILLAAATNYGPDHTKNFRSDQAPAPVTMARIERAEAKGWDALRRDHVAEHHGWMSRSSLDLGTSTPAQRALPTDQRRKAAVTTTDPELEALLYQYGRYLLIGCSRPGGLPANLQGLWNDLNNPAWHGDYHANINVQMSYWPAEITGLPECHEPFLDLITSQIPVWRQATAADQQQWFKPYPGVPAGGWAIRTSHNIYGGMGWLWDPTANAWYAHHFWEHFAFTQDRTWLRNVAWPLMREVADFWLPRLKALPDGRLVVPNGWSPEQGPHEDGVSYNQQILWNHLANCVEAADVLGEDRAWRDRVADARDRLVGPKIGSWGQLQEWMVDRDDPKSTHRHTSHLFAVYPGRQIAPVSTPDLAKAAHVSLVARTDGGNAREWSYAWRANLYARLRDAEAAHRQVQFFLGTTTANLFGYHPPVVLDGGFGITAGIAEMLLQSQDGGLDLLPALPAAWPTGSVTGLRARGGFTVDLAWRDGRLTEAVITSRAGRSLTVRSNGKTATVPTAVGQVLPWNANLELR